MISQLAGASIEQDSKSPDGVVFVVGGMQLTLRDYQELERAEKAVLETFAKLAKPRPAKATIQTDRQNESSAA